MAISERKASKYREAFAAVEKNDLMKLMKIVTVMANLKYSEKCPLEDSPFFGSGLIHAAACHGSPEVVTFLMNRGNGVNLRGHLGKSPMHCAIADRKKNSAEILQILIEAVGAKINSKDADGDTLLHYAVGRDIKLVEILVKHGAKVGLKNIWGETPLHVAAERGDIQIMKYLLNHKADIDARDNNDESPLRHALMGRDPEKAVSFLLSSGANPDDPDSKGNTTLHCAAASGEDKVALKLIKAGADRSIRNADGLTASDIARDPAVSGKLRAPKKRGKKTPKDMSKPAPIKQEQEETKKKSRKRARILPSKAVGIHMAEDILQK